MSWAERRRATILIIIGAVAFAFVVIILIATFYKAPTCTDGAQNGDEQGVDCGGSCAYRCAAQVASASVRFALPLSPFSGRTDIIAYIDNPNASLAAKKAPFTVKLYGPDGMLVASGTGAADLPPASVIPVFIPNLYTGSQPVARAFLTLDAGAQFYEYQDARTIPQATGWVNDGTADAPRIVATLANPSAKPLYDVKVVAAVFDAGTGNAVAASQTVVPSIPPGGTAQAVFTWNAPFAAAAVSVDVKPVIPLP